MQRRRKETVTPEQTAKLTDGDMMSKIQPDIRQDIVASAPMAALIYRNV